MAMSSSRMKYMYKGIIKSLQSNVAFFYFEPLGPGKPIVTAKTCVHIHAFEPLFTSFIKRLQMDSYEVVERYETQGPYDYALHIQSVLSKRNKKKKVKYYKPENKVRHGIVLDYNQDTRMFTVAFGQSVSMLSYEQVSLFMERKNPQYNLNLIKVNSTSDELKMNKLKARYLKDYDLHPSSSDVLVPGQSRFGLQALFCAPVDHLSGFQEMWCNLTKYKDEFVMDNYLHRDASGDNLSGSCLTEDSDVVVESSDSDRLMKNGVSDIVRSSDSDVVVESSDSDEENYKYEEEYFKDKQVYYEESSEYEYEDYFFLDEEEESNEDEEEAYYVDKELAGLTLDDLESLQPCLPSLELDRSIVTISHNLYRDTNSDK